MIRAAAHLLRALYYGVAMRHLLRTDPTHEDLPRIVVAYADSASAVRRYLDRILV